jgi:hypothetical protein
MWGGSPLPEISKLIEDGPARRNLSLDKAMLQDVIRRKM